MLESTMAAAAGGAGGILGQLGSVLSAPRRFAWDALGLPEDGASLLDQTFGMDKDSPWTKILGMGAEAVGDPLTYAGMLLGGPLAKAGASFLNGRQAAPLAEEIAGLSAARRAAQEGLVSRAGMEAGTVDSYAAQAAALAKDHDLASIAGGRTRSYNSFSDPMRDSMTNAGMASVDDAGKLVTLGEGVPPGVSMRQLASGARGQKAGSVMDISPLVADGNAAGAAHPYKGMQPLLPDELAHLQSTAKENLGNRWRQLRNPEAPFGQQQLVDDFANQLSSRANATRPMPSLGIHMRDQMLPTSGLTQGILDSPLPQAFSATQEALASALARKKALDAAGLATAITRGDYAKLGGGSFLASLGLGSEGR